MSRVAFLAALLLSGCASAPVVAIKPGYDFTKLGRVALMDFKDFPGKAGSGAGVSRTLEPYLLHAGYDLIERGEVEKLLQEQSLGGSGAIDPSTAKSVGKLLGADALVLGSVTADREARSSTYLQNVQNVRYQPVYETIQHQDKDGKIHTRQQIAQYDVVTTSEQIPQTFTSPATVAFTARLVDVSSGQVLWSGSSSSEGESVADAATTASERLVKALKKAWPVQQ